MKSENTNSLNNSDKSIITSDNKPEEKKKGIYKNFISGVRIKK